MVTREKFEKTYGRFEMSAKLPSGAGVWAAFWILGDPEIYGPWPNRGELDIMEYVGADPEVILGTAFAKANLSVQGTIESDGVEDGFHIYVIEWNEDTIKWFFDDSIYHEYIRDVEFDPSWQQWPFDQPFYIILNIAMGGALGGEVDNNIFANGVKMEIEYVRVIDQISRTGIVGDNKPVASEQGVIYHFPKDDAISYNWSVPEGATITSGNSTSLINIDWGCTYGDIILEINTSECGIDTVSLPVNFENISIDGEHAAFENETGLSFKAPALSNGSYSWTVTDDATIISCTNTNEITVNFGTTSGTVSVDVTTSCGITQYDVFVTISDILSDFETVSLDFIGFVGSEFEIADNPDPSGINTSTKVGKTWKSPGSPTWAGIYADLGYELDFSVNHYFVMKVYGEKTGTIFLLKISIHFMFFDLFKI
jgi:hypothetical protein